MEVFIHEMSPKEKESYEKEGSIRRQYESGMHEGTWQG